MCSVKLCSHRSGAAACRRAVPFVVLRFVAAPHPVRARCVVNIFMPAPLRGGHFGVARSVRLSVPWRSYLGYRL